MRESKERYGRKYKHYPGNIYIYIYIYIAIDVTTGTALELCSDTEDRISSEDGCDSSPQQSLSLGERMYVEVADMFVVRDGIPEALVWLHRLFRDPQFNGNGC